ncbi:hypothetical protein J7M22_03005, partial [Candidatus Poribacteria bacterium]|nr:hypothetical protein [Candidatus Poribacteria bacterium]
ARYWGSTPVDDAKGLPGNDHYRLMSVTVILRSCWRMPAEIFRLSIDATSWCGSKSSSAPVLPSTNSLPT